MTPDQFEFPGFPTPAEQARNQGIDQVLENNKAWAEAIASFFINVWLPSKPEGYEFICEDFRHDAMNSGVQPPQHPNAWGGVFAHMVRHPEVQWTGRARKTVGIPSHARRSFIYRKCIPE